MSKANTRKTVKYSFFQVDPLWRRLPADQKTDGKEEFAAVVEEFASHMPIRSYGLVGLRADADFLLWQIADSLEAVQELAVRLNHTGLGKYLRTPYSYLAMTRRSEYVDDHRHPGQEGTRLTIKPSETPYLVLYPFVKTRQWYLLPKEERQRMMNLHFEVGHRYPTVKINTTYSFGLDDQEFVVAFNTTSPSDFLDLVEELRHTETSGYTLRDTPVFTCIARPLRETLDALG
ncbi:MAG: chlorite dismutase family protein [Chloroflexi bacterium]|nr:chlorite dismutase family protein [Chloroflexota bacterium]